MKCLNCGVETDNPKFCSRHCSVSFTNRGRRRHGKKPGNCLNCGKKLLRSKLKYCSVPCNKEYNYENYIERWQKGEIDGSRKPYGVSYYIRRYLFEKYENRCCKCGWSKVNKFSGKVPLEINHINGNWKNNKEENLELICPNCHSLTKNYKFLNNGKGRKERSKYYAAVV